MIKPLIEKAQILLSEGFLFSQQAFYIACSFVLIPLVAIITSFLIDYQEIVELKERVALLQKKSEKKEARAQHEEKIVQQIQTSHSSYLENVVGSMLFLGSERQKWKIFSEQLEPSSSMKQRVNFLEKGNNSLRFSEVEVRKVDFFQETEEKQIAPVEVGEEDLKNLLCKIEGSPIHPHLPQKGAPQILIKSFELEKKSSPGLAEKTYQVQMQLIKREGTQKP